MSSLGLDLTQDGLTIPLLATACIILSAIFLRWLFCGRSTIVYNFQWTQAKTWLLKRNKNPNYTLGNLKPDLRYIEKQIHELVKANAPYNLKKYGEEEAIKRGLQAKERVVRFLAVVLPPDCSIEHTLQSLTSNSTWDRAIINGKQHGPQEKQQTQQQLQQQCDQNGEVEVKSYEEFSNTELYKEYYIDYLKYLTKIPSQLHEPLRTELSSTHICSLCQESFRSNWEQAFGKTVYHRTITAFRQIDGQTKAFSLCNLHSQTWGPMLMDEKHGSDELKAYHIS